MCGFGGQSRGDLQWEGRGNGWDNEVMDIFCPMWILLMITWGQTSVKKRRKKKSTIKLCSFFCMTVILQF